MPVTLHDRHPLVGFFRKIDGPQVEIVVGGPSIDVDPDETDPTVLVGAALERSREEVVRNHWFSRKRNADVLIYQHGDRFFPLVIPCSPDGSMDRLTFWLSTLGASDAWDLEAEERAQVKLRGLVTDRQWRHYQLTGAFLETSPRSGLTYVFRRSRPTLALTPHHPRTESMMCLAVLCLHPVGYYRKTWAGCMVPTDDVIAHLVSMRADEAYFWRKANQHDPASPEAGL